VFLVGLGAALSMLGFLLWLWFIGTFLCSLVEPPLKSKQDLFRLAITYPLAFGFVISLYTLVRNPYLLALLIFLNLLALACIVYDLNFVATALSVAETGKSRVFSQIVGTFFLLWFFPVGIWIIQPKINRLYQEHNVPR
jgi:hypothetical protein